MAKSDSNPPSSGRSTFHLDVLGTVRHPTLGDGAGGRAALGARLQPGGALGSYCVQKLIGRGGHGLVFRAAHVHTYQSVVLKTLHPEHVSGSGRRSLINEARILAGVSHPRVVRLIELFEVDRFPVLVLDYVPGDTLAARVAASGPLQPRHALRVAAQLVTALQAAWNHGVCHRDVKPENVILDPDDEAVLIDFGSARDVGVHDEVDAIGSGQTVAYMAPELYYDNKPDVRGDIYALGGCLFYAVTGRLPYSADSPMEMMIRHTEDPVPSACRLSPAVPIPFGRLIARMLAKKPERRPPDYCTLLTEMAAVADPMGVDTADWVPVWV
jgi:serine/threonine-protein kinase